MSVELGKRLENLRESKGWNKTYVSKKIGLKTMQTYAYAHELSHIILKYSPILVR